MNQRKLWAGVILFGMISASAAFAQSYREDGIRIGSEAFRYIPGVTVGSSSLKAAVTTEGQYDSNIFLTPNDKKSDYIGIVSPKLLWDVPIGIDQRHLIQVLYTADVASFSNYKSENYVDQHVAGNVNLRLPWGYFNLQDSFRDTVERSGTEFTDQVRRQDNDAQATLGVEINKLTYELGVGQFLRRYDDPLYDDLKYNENVLSGTVFYQLFPKTKALLEYAHGQVDYLKDSLRDGTYDHLMTGLKGIISGKTTGVVKAGYKTRDYDDPSQQGFTGFVAEAIVGTEFSERRELELRYSRNVLESISAGENYYDQNAFYLMLTQRIKNHFALSFISGYQLNAYPEVDPTIGKKRRDDVLTQEVRLTYDVKSRARISLGYEYQERASNANDNDYDNHIISLRFDFLL